MLKPKYRVCRSIDHGLALIRSEPRAISRAVIVGNDESRFVSHTYGGFFICKTRGTTFHPLATITPSVYIFGEDVTPECVLSGFRKDWNSNVQWEEDGSRFKMFSGKKYIYTHDLYDGIIAEPVTDRQYL